MGTNLTNAEVLLRAFQDPTSGVYLIDHNAIRSVARQNDKRPATIEFHVPDEFVKNITGGTLVVDHYFMLMVPALFVDKLLKEKDNQAINEPGEVRHTEPTAQEE